MVVDTDTVWDMDMVVGFIAQAKNTHFKQLVPI
jgi:hypothetical protein